MSKPQFATFEEFWPYYVRAHSNKQNRMLHFCGTTLALGALALGASSRRRRWMLALAPVVGYGPAWVGHFFVEGNVPATFGHPLWSLRADLRMYGQMLAGTMDAEVQRVAQQQAASEQTAGEQTAGEQASNTYPRPAGSNGAGKPSHEELDELRNRTAN